MKTVIIIDQDAGHLRQLSQIIRESNTGIVGILCKDLAAAEAAIASRDSINNPVDAVVIEEGARGERVASIYETLAFLRKINGRQGAIRPRVVVLTEQRHGDPLFAGRFDGCATYRKVNVLNGSTVLDLP